ncbi:MAG: ABC transporter permease [Desulfobacteraceae bacterium]|nr:MAG: ABC transporter permease [Desulfobacteraceae bacterium]
MASNGSLKRLRRRLPPTSICVAAVWAFLMYFTAFGADFIAPYDYESIDLRARLAPPIWMSESHPGHWLGTDNLGRDILSRLIFSIRMSLLIAALGTMMSAVLGSVIGFMAAHHRGWVGEVILLMIDFQSALPFLILALAVLAFFDNNMALFIVVMGIYGWERYARLARSLALSATAQGYAVAMTTLGATTWRIYLRHILPNVASTLIVNMTVNFPEIIMVETSLSFLGLGVQPPNTSLGSMVGFGRQYLFTAWWIAAFPAFVIFVSTLAFSLLGDWVRDKLDPILRDS